MKLYTGSNEISRNLPKIQSWTFRKRSNFFVHGRIPVIPRVLQQTGIYRSKIKWQALTGFHLKIRGAFEKYPEKIRSLKIYIYYVMRNNSLEYSACTKITFTYRVIPEYIVLFSYFIKLQNSSICSWKTYHLNFKIFNEVRSTGNSNVWEKEKLLLTSNFSFSHRVFYRFE